MASQTGPSVARVILYAKKDARFLSVSRISAENWDLVTES